MYTFAPPTPKQSVQQWANGTHINALLLLYYIASLVVKVRSFIKHDQTGAIYNVYDKHMM